MLFALLPGTLHFTQRSPESIAVGLGSWFCYNCFTEGSASKLRAVNNRARPVQKCWRSAKSTTTQLGLWLTHLQDCQLLSVSHPLPYGSFYQSQETVLTCVPPTGRKEGALQRARCWDAQCWQCSAYCCTRPCFQNPVYLCDVLYCCFLFQLTNVTPHYFWTLDFICVHLFAWSPLHFVWGCCNTNSYT